MNVGLFGGTFNPIHLGHIAVITHVKTAFRLDCIHVIPAAVPPHKHNSTLASAADRFHMVQTAVSKLPGLVASDVELNRVGKSFSIDTIRYFREMLKSVDDLYFIMGSDAFFDINTWKNSAEIFRVTEIIIMKRAGDKRDIEDVASFLKKEISSEYELPEALQAESAAVNDDPRTVHHPLLKSVHICKVPEIDISSTLIRARIENGESLEGFLSSDVEIFIKKKGLYMQK